MNTTIDVEPSHRWVAFVCSGTWQLSMPGFPLGSVRRHQTGCVCLGIPMRQGRQGIVKLCSTCAALKFELCLLSNILEYFQFEVVFWEISGRMGLCFPQIAKDFMGNKQLILWPVLPFQPLSKQRYRCPKFWTLLQVILPFQGNMLK